LQHSQESNNPEEKGDKTATEEDFLEAMQLLRAIDRYAHTFILVHARHWPAQQQHAVGFLDALACFLKAAFSRVLL
jgi:hypothetical protein